MNPAVIPEAHRAVAHVFTDRTGSPVNLRLAVEDDAEALIAFIKQVDAETTFLSREPGEFTVPVPQERMLIRQTNARRNSIYMVAEVDGAIAATLDFHGGTRERTMHAGEFGMSVRRAYWGRGLGSRLLDTMIAWARETGQLKRIKLRVQAGNERAIALYRSRGFIDEGVLAREFRVRGQWVDVLIMALWIEGHEGA